MSLWLFQNKISLTRGLLWEDLVGKLCVPGQIQLHGGKEHFQSSGSADLAANLKAIQLADVLQVISISKHLRQRRRGKKPERNVPWGQFVGLAI